jgi:hypothetical protein
MDSTTPTEEPRARTLAAQGVANAVVHLLLHVPLLCRLVGRRLIIVYVVGRTSGRRFPVPVAYTADGADLLVGTPFRWGRNLRSGEPVEILLKGRRRKADVQVFADEAGVVGHYAIMARDNAQFARFNRIARDAAGDPDPDDLHAAWRAGARAFRLRPR